MIVQGFAGAKRRPPAPHRLAIAPSDQMLQLPISALDSRWGAGTSFRSREALDDHGWHGADLGVFGNSEEQKPWLAALFAALTQDVPLDHYNIVGDLWMWIWLFISSILLVNLLIAMFTETYE